jgi:hypothetical protein
LWWWILGWGHWGLGNDSRGFLFWAGRDIHILIILGRNRFGFGFLGVGEVLFNSAPRGNGAATAIIVRVRRLGVRRLVLDSAARSVAGARTKIDV